MLLKNKKTGKVEEWSLNLERVEDPRYDDGECLCRQNVQIFDNIAEKWRVATAKEWLQITLELGTDEDGNLDACVLRCVRGKGAMDKEKGEK